MGSIMTASTLSETITFDGRKITPGDSFQPFTGDEYTVTYVRIDTTAAGESLVLRDCCGEFTRPIRDLRKAS